MNDNIRQVVGSELTDRQLDGVVGGITKEQAQGVADAWNQMQNEMHMPASALVVLEPASCTCVDTL
jgi:hypothetical protein